MSSMLPQAGRLAKPVQVDSTRRTVQVFKQHEEYRKRYFKDLRDAINDTDYLVGIADESSAQVYYNQTGRHRVVKLAEMELPTDPEEIEEMKYRNPVSPRIPSYLKKRVKRPWMSPREWATQHLPRDDEEGVEIVEIYEDEQLAEHEQDSAEGEAQEGASREKENEGAAEDAQKDANEEETEEEAAGAEGEAGNEEETTEEGAQKGEVAAEEAGNEAGHEGESTEEGAHGAENGEVAENAENEAAHDGESAEAGAENGAAEEGESTEEAANGARTGHEGESTEEGVQKGEAVAENGENEAGHERESAEAGAENAAAEEAENVAGHVGEATEEGVEKGDVAAEEECKNGETAATEEEEAQTQEAGDRENAENVGAEGETEEGRECEADSAVVSDGAAQSSEGGASTGAVGSLDMGAVKPDKVKFVDLSPRSKLARARSQDGGISMAKYIFIDTRRSKWDIIGASDDGIGDERPSNCGLGPNGSAELVLQISAADLGHGNLEGVTIEECEQFRAKGFTWLLVTDIEDGVNLEPVANAVRSAGMKFMVDYSGPESVKFVDAVRCGPEDVTLRNDNPNLILIGRSEGNGFDYMYDYRPAAYLASREFDEFVDFMKWVDEDQRKRFLHYSVRNGFDFHDRAALTASAALLLLPGMRVVANDHMDMAEIIVKIAHKKAVRRGVFTNIDVSVTYGNMVAWKYTRGRQHILICVNFGDKHAIGSVKCEDVPNAESEDGRISILELMTDTTYMRDVSELRTTGLTVILYEYQIQVFEY